MTRAGAATYGVRGLTCVRCVMSAIEAVRALPGVRGVGVDLVPFGESLVTVDPATAAAGEQVRASLGQAGFELTTSYGRRPPLAGRLRVSRAWQGLAAVMPLSDLDPILT